MIYQRKHEKHIKHTGARLWQEEIPQEAGDVVYGSCSGKYFTETELDLLDRPMSDCGWFPEILQTFLWPV